MTDHPSCTSARRKSAKPAGWWMAALMAAAMAAGCAAKITYLPPGTTYGNITLSKPRVSTRERLINDRLEEERWLQGQLALTDSLEFGNQGSSDIRSFSGTSVRAGVQADQGAVGLYRETKAAELDEARRQRALRELDYKIALARKEKELADAQANPLGATSSFTVTPPTPAQPASAPRVNVSGQLEGLAKSLEDLGGKISTLTGRGTATAPVPTTAAASPIDTFRDRLAYREEIRSELISNALDDAHDLAGNSLYRLSFDATIFPGTDTSAWAVVGVQASTPKDASTNWVTTTTGTGTASVTMLSYELPKGHVRPSRFLRIVTSRIDEEALDFAQQVLRECRAEGARVPACLMNMRQDSLLQLQTYARLANEANSATTPAGAETEEIFLKSRAFSSLLIGPYALQPAGRTSTPLVSAAEADRLAQQFHRASSASQGSSNAERTAESVAAGAYVEVARALRFRLAGGPDFKLSRGDTVCELNAPKRLLGFAVRTNGTLYISSPQLAKLTVLREQHSPDQFEADGQWPREGDCEQGYLARVRKSMESMAMTGRGKVYAYSATPKETVQRVSEVLARREASELALALQAVTGAASIDTMFSYIRANDALFHALRRQPLIVGYAGGMGPMNRGAEESFGWIFGPKYEIRYDGREPVPAFAAFGATKQSAGFRHAPIQNNVSAVVSVPAAYESLDLLVSRCWSNGDENWGLDAAAARAVPSRLGPDKCFGTENLSISLPLDERRVFHLQRTPFSNERDIRLAGDTPARYVVRTGEPASLLIRGEHLWRNTKVLMGSQEADTVKVLPDMRGIIAMFNKVLAPTESGGRRQLDLRVVTSEKSIVAGPVHFEDAAAPAAVRWSLGGPKLFVPAETLALAATPRLPSAYNSFELRAANPARSRAGRYTSKDFEVAELTQSVGMKIGAAASFPAWQNGEQVTLEFVTNRFPEDTSPLIQAVEPAVFYKTRADAEITAAAKTAGGKSKVVLTMPPEFRKAYPVLANAAGLTVGAHFEGADASTARPHACALKVAAKATTCEFEVANPENKKLLLAIGRGAEDGYPGITVK